jgi:hypothetical protein
MNHSSLRVALILPLAAVAIAAYALHGIHTERPASASGAPPPTT